MAEKSQAELEDERQYRVLGLDEIDENYPHRPRNHSKTITFWDLCTNLFIPLVEARNKSAKKHEAASYGRSKLPPHEIRRSIVEHFISRWRKDVGDDLYPAFRLVLPDKDKERAMYGLKEKTIAKLLIKVTKIDANSEDAKSMSDWKSPRYSSSITGDFAARCHEVLAKRPLRIEPGTMTLADVNEKLDLLSMAQKDEDQRPLIDDFYRLMNAEELTWLIRIVLRQMKIGTNERTIFHIFHPDAENLFSICSNLRRVCWELANPETRLGNEDVEVTLMQIFQPQLAQFQMYSFDRIIDRVVGKEDERTFWIEEKLDGERMQLHMMADPNTPGGRAFAYYSRRAKDYTYLYGKSYEDIGALSKHLKDAFHDGVQSIILDGEMITWDVEDDIMLPFGTLKTAALEAQHHAKSSRTRPLFKVFDIVYLNGKCLTNYSLRDRRRALQRAVKEVHRRLEILPYKEASDSKDIDPLLRNVVAERGEGLVIKNPNSMYRLNERNDDWMKVKPEYMTEFGENLDLVVIGGYYGSGHRGGILSSYLCGLRVSDDVENGASQFKCYSFCKCGGGFSFEDYKKIAHLTEGKWQDWDPKKPPTDIIELAGGILQYERPDVWIRPDQSFVIEVKAASVSTTDQFRLGLTLRFPRLKRLRLDKSWQEALSVEEFIKLKANVEEEKKDKEFQVAQSRRAQVRRSKKRKVVVAGTDKISARYVHSQMESFKGLKFLILSDSSQPKKSKQELEQLVKENGGTVVQMQGEADTKIIAERRTVKAASAMKKGQDLIIKPTWIFDCIQQNKTDAKQPSFLLPFEPSRHIFFEPTAGLSQDSAVDASGDSYARDTTVEELSELFDGMPTVAKKMAATERNALLKELEAF